MKVDINCEYQDVKRVRRFLVFAVVPILLMSVLVCSATITNLSREVVNLRFANDALKANISIEEIRGEVARMALLEANENLERANELFSELFDKDDGFVLAHVIRYPVTISAYSLSVDECDDDPLTAAFGPSRIAMVAPSTLLVAIANLKPGDRYAIVSNDGSVRMVGIYWDHMSSRWEDMRVDIIAPAKEVAKWHGIKDGYFIKLVGKG